MDAIVFTDLPEQDSAAVMQFYRHHVAPVIGGLDLLGWGYKISMHGRVEKPTSISVAFGGIFVIVEGDAGRKNVD